LRATQSSILRNVPTAKLSSPMSPAPWPKLQAYYDAFRREFGHEVLRSLDGQELLERMYAHCNHDSLVHWLEFKGAVIESPCRDGCGQRPN